MWNIDEQKWFDSLKDAYGLTVNKTVRPAATLYSSQLIAVKAGMPLDIIYCQADNCAAPLTLMQSIADIAVPGDNAPFNARLFERSGGKLLAPGGFCKALWYDKAAVKGDPLAEMHENVWTADRLSQYGDKPLAAKSWLAFGSAGAASASAMAADRYTFTVTDEGVIASFAAFAPLTGGKKPQFEYSLSSDKNACVPIPQAGEGGRYVCSFAGGAMGVSVSAKPENRAPAAALAALWCLRATEARTDALLFKNKMSPADVDAYLEFCGQYGDAYEFDGEVNEALSGDQIPAGLGADPDSAYAVAGTAYRRVSLLNERR